MCHTFLFPSTPKLKDTEHIMAVAEQVKAIIVKQLGVDEAEVTEDSSFIDDLGADSLDIVELVMAFEQEFRIVIDEAEMATIWTVRQAIEYIQNCIEKQT
jgi:acyl carrier protein